MTPNTEPHCLALCGGVGGAKLAAGLARALAPGELAVVCNTGDDFEHLGLPISPDLDTVMYTLADRADAQRGWGLANESWRTMDTLAALGGPAWFRLGDQDLATHLYRLHRRLAGAPLSAITDELCAALGVRHALWPMSDDPVRTVVRLAAGGELAFQHYFVREACAPTVSGFRFDGAERARPQPRLMALLARRCLRAVIVCPSNPFVSVDPMLALPGLRAALRAGGAPVIAVSPIVGGQAIKGPAAKMMAELALPVNSTGVAAHYGDLLDGIVVDTADAAEAPGLRARGLQVLVTPTVMRGATDRHALARTVLDWANTWPPERAR